MTVQVIVILIQHFIDPRLTILTTHILGYMLPPKYNYHRPIPISILEEGECKCVICMSEIEVPHSKSDNEEDVEMEDAPLLSRRSHHVTLEESEKQSPSPSTPGTKWELGSYSSPDIMVTPCNHVFHTACLERWKEYKLECPLCKKELPIG